MKVEFIKSENSSQLILIFAGWSASPDLFSDVDRKGWDVAVVYNFSELSLDISVFDKYSTIIIYAWSLGVRAAALLMPPSKVAAAFAINGTLAPVDDFEGIPRNIYFGTAENLDSRNLMKFRRRMAGDPDTFKKYFSQTFSQPEIDSLQQQLYNIANFQGALSELPWQKAYISDSDRIFPADNMMRHWKNRGVKSEIVANAPHFLNLSDIVRSTIPDTDIIARKFSDSYSTYDKNAKAQLIIAKHLSDILKAEIMQNKESNRVSAKPIRILEIGPGTGFLTRQYTSFLRPAEIDFVDIANVPKIGASQIEHYYCDDAESWIRRMPQHTYDYILSSSALQWFVNIPEFLRQCHRVLRPGGILAFSTFTTGNLAELDQFRPSPIIYHDKGKYIDWLSENFEISHCSEDTIALQFASARELLIHLKLTGVGGSVKTESPLRLSNLRDTRILSYRPLYLLARQLND